jgi:hypothetical protein
VTFYCLEDPICYPQPPGIALRQDEQMDALVALPDSDAELAEVHLCLLTRARLIAHGRDGA